MTRIGVCTESGMEAMAKVGESFFREVHGDQDFDLGYYHRFWLARRQDGQGVLLGEFDGDVPVGICGMIYSQDLWSGKPVAAVVCLYSKSKTGGVRLLLAARKIAKLRKVAKIHYTHMNTAKSGRISSLYRRLGATCDAIRYTEDVWEK